MTTIESIRWHPLTVRGLLAATGARVALQRLSSQRPLERALMTSACGALPPEERAWHARIEAVRRRTMRVTAPTHMPTVAPRESGSRPSFAMDGPEAELGALSAMMSLGPVWCRFLMRLVRELRPAACLELGTAFGISAAYQGAALALNGGGSLTSMEGSEAWAERARANLAGLDVDAEIVVGPIERTLGEVVEAGPFEFVFCDAEHQEETTMGYFHALLPALAPGAYLVFDDVQWPEMQSAFARVAAHPRVAAAHRVGRLGIAITTPEPPS